MPIEFAKNYPGIIVAAFSFVILLLGAVVGLLIKIIWKIISDLKDTMDRWYGEHRECKERQERDFLKVGVFEDWKADVFEGWKEGRTGSGGIIKQIGELWDALNHHTHSEKGKVER